MSLLVYSGQTPSVLVLLSAGSAAIRAWHGRRIGAGRSRAVLPYCPGLKLGTMRSEGMGRTVLVP